MQSELDMSRFVDEPGMPVARVRIARGRRGSMHRTLALTPYELQTLVDDLAWPGDGTTVEVTLPADAPPPLVARAERELGRLRPHGVNVVIRRGDGDAATPARSTPAPSSSRTVAEVAVMTGRLLHELQSERAVAAAHLVARAGAYREHLDAQWAATDGVRETWRELLDARAETLPPLVQMHADAVCALATQLPAWRRAVGERAPVAADAGDYYTQLARALLATGDGLLVASDAAPIATAHLAFLHAKEEAALEQIEVAAAAVTQTVPRAVAAHVASREAYLRTFATTASEPVLSEYRALMAEPECCEATGLERALMDHAERPEEPLDTVAWYRSLGSVVERFRDLETHSAATLLQSAT